MIKTLAVLAWALSGSASAAPASAPAAAADAPPAAAPAGPTVETYYSAGKARDPFVKSLSAGPTVKPPPGPGPVEPPAFSIHDLSLKALMKDSAADYAFFSDAATGLTYILRRGRLYDPKGDSVKGLSGKIDIKKKTAVLATPDKDTQIYRLGEEEKDKEDGSGTAAPGAKG